jgi:hypothetical protein
MELAGRRRAGVGGDDHLVAQIARVAHGRLDRIGGRHAGADQPARPMHGDKGLERRAEERVVADVGDHQLVAGRA